VKHVTNPPAAEPDSRLRLCGTNATVTLHCAARGVERIGAAFYKVEVGCDPASGGPVVRVYCREPQRPNGFWYEAAPGGFRYLTVEEAGEVVYDSREDAPCDMGKWRELKEGRGDSLAALALAWRATAARGEAEGSRHREPAQGEAVEEAGLPPSPRTSGGETGARTLRPDASRHPQLASKKAAARATG
jgi:hypothetical protein